MVTSPAEPAHHDATPLLLTGANSESHTSGSATPRQGTQNPRLGALIALHVSLHLFPSSATRHGSGSGYISHPSCPSPFPSAHRHLAATACPHRHREEKGGREGSRGARAAGITTGVAGVKDAAPFDYIGAAVLPARHRLDTAPTRHRTAILPPRPPRSRLVAICYVWQTRRSHRLRNLTPTTQTTWVTTYQGRIRNCSIDCDSCGLWVNKIIAKGVARVKDEISQVLFLCTFLSVLLGELVSRSINFFISKGSKLKVQDVEDSLQRVRLRAQVIISEATGRHITNEAMLQQLDMLRDAMYQGNYMLDTFRYQSYDVEHAKVPVMEAQHVISFLLNKQPHGSEELEVLPIVGPYRVGKSTLISRHFQISLPHSSVAETRRKTPKRRSFSIPPIGMLAVVRWAFVLRSFAECLPMWSFILQSI